MLSRNVVELLLICAINKLLTPNQSLGPKRVRPSSMTSFVVKAKAQELSRNSNTLKREVEGGGEPVMFTSCCPAKLTTPLKTSRSFIRKNESDNLWPMRCIGAGLAAEYAYRDEFDLFGDWLTKHFLHAAKPTGLLEADSSFLIFSQRMNGGLNSHNKHGYICNLGHKFQI